jgi:SAM-dependent methyltransferase
LVGAALAPVYWMLAYRAELPGMYLHYHATRLAFRMLVGAIGRVPLSTPFYHVFFPMDSTRYVEFDFMWRAWPAEPVARYLDVSSPRLFTLLTLARTRLLQASLLNPDGRDLAITVDQATVAGLADHCEFYQSTIEAAPLPAEWFDVITCISVLEHIPNDGAALRCIWRLLRPVGRLLLSVPCAAAEFEQYIDRYDYSVLQPAENGFTFWQRFYDEPRLRSVVFSVTGAAVRSSIYGEKQAGLFQRNANRKRTDPRYPFWREPYMMASEFRRFDSVASLPGEGVICLEFRKA